MSDLHVLPDVESLVIAYLKADDDVTDLVAATKIASELPPKATFPFLQAFLVSSPVVVERHLVRARVQIDAWGTTRLQARTLCATAHAALVEMSGTQPAGLGVVSGVLTAQGPRPLHDSVTDRPRFTSDLFVYAHAEPDLGS